MKVKRSGGKELDLTSINDVNNVYEIQNPGVIPTLLSLRNE